MNCSDVGAETVDSWRDVSWDCSWPSSNCRELIRESFSESEDLRDAISFSFEAREVECWDMSRLFFSYNQRLNKKAKVLLGI